MNVKEAIEKRISVRAFLDKPVETEKLIRILELSKRAPSWKNAQAYKIAVVLGEKRKTLEERLVAAAISSTPETPDYPYQHSYPPYLKKRMFDLGMAYYAHMGVDRKDKERRMELSLLNLKFFGAPVGLFFFMESGMDFWPAIDLGILMGNIMLAAREEGLETIAQASLAGYPQIVKKELGIEENWKLCVGMSIGYADPLNIANSFYTNRVPQEENIVIYS